MLLRRISQHVTDQNWFAVVLDFLIVVAGILIAFQITNWRELQSEKADLVRAEIAMNDDLIDNYVNAKERIVLSECRKLSLQALGNRLLQVGDSWETAPNVNNDSKLAAFPSVVRSPKRYWKDRIWETELARGSFDLMDPDRRRDIDNVFRAVRAMATFQVELGDNESRLKILGQASELSRDERHRLFEVVSAIDEHSVALEQIGRNIIDGIEDLKLTLNHNQLTVLSESIERLNAGSIGKYGECRKPITTPLLKNFITEEKP